MLFVPMPTVADKSNILKTLTRHTPLAEDVCFIKIAEDSRTSRYTGAGKVSFIQITFPQHFTFTRSSYKLSLISPSSPFTHPSSSTSVSPPSFPPPLLLPKPLLFHDISTQLFVYLTFLFVPFPLKTLVN